MSKGKYLAEKLGIDCNQALYSERGNFYAPIRTYPCVLFDKAGFIVVNSSSELDGFGIKFKKRTNVSKLISSASTYQLISAWQVNLAEEVLQEDNREYFEGIATTISVNRYERNREARNKCISRYGCVCQACGTKLSDIYGPAARDCIHVHHITTISSVGEEYQLDPILDLIPLCPNCHAVTHLRKEPYSIKELQDMIATCKDTD